MSGPEVIAWPSFEEALKRLRRKYPHVEQDVREALQNPTQARPIPGYEHKLWKLRVRSRDQQRGKRGGFRLIYYFDYSATSTPQRLYTLTIYAKSERADIPVKELIRLYSRFTTFLRERLQR